MPADTALQSADSPEESASKGDYTLLALLGERPQVLTLLLWSLVDKRDEYPKRVIVLTTAHGERHLRAKLLEDSSYRGSRIKNQGNRWGTFCRKVLGYDPLEPDKDIEVPTDFEGNKVEDIEEEDDEQLFASWCYDLVRSLTRKSEGPLYGLIAGGRKTMTPDITTAFSLYGLRDDKLFHVIVPKRLERKREFFWPCADWDHDEYADDVHLVQKPFLHLQIKLEDLLSSVDGVGKRSHYGELLDELDADRQALARPQKVTLRLQKAPDGVRDKRRSDSTLSVWDETGEPMVEKRLSVKHLATLLFLWDYLWEPGKRRCFYRSLFKSETADRYRRPVYEAFYDRYPIPGDDYMPWNPENEYYNGGDDSGDDEDNDGDDSGDDEDDGNAYNSEYSNSTSPLKKRVLETEPVLKRYFLFFSVPRDARSEICDCEDPAYAFRRSLPASIELNIEVSRDEFDDLRPLTTALDEEDPFRQCLPTPNVVDG